MNERTFPSASESDTDRIASHLAAVLEPGLIVCLEGPLGAGKTRFVQGIAKALGCDNQFVSSPTFTLIHEYQGRLPVYHVDAYRLADSDEFLELGGEELLNADGPVFIEWSQRIADILPQDVLRIALTVTGPNERELRLTAAGPTSRRVLEGMHHGDTETRRESETDRGLSG